MKCREVMGQDRREVLGEAAAAWAVPTPQVRAGVAFARIVAIGRLTQRDSPAIRRRAPSVGRRWAGDSRFHLQSTKGGRSCQVEMEQVRAGWVR